MKNITNTKEIEERSNTCHAITVMVGAGATMIMALAVIYKIYRPEIFYPTMIMIMITIMAHNEARYWDTKHYTHTQTRRRKKPKT